MVVGGDQEDDGNPQIIKTTMASHSYLELGATCRWPGSPVTSTILDSSYSARLDGGISSFPLFGTWYRSIEESDSLYVTVCPVSCVSDAQHECQAFVQGLDICS